MSKRFCFTSFDEKEPGWNPEIHGYLVFGKEKCPETGRHHWQGYVEFLNKTAKSYKKIMKDLGIINGHIEKCRGDARSNIEYCKKDNKFHVFGTPMKQGERNDLACVTEGKLSDVPTDLLVKYSRGILFARNIKNRIKRNWVTEVEIHQGPPGTGKSKAMPIDAYWKSPDNKWWDGYDGEEFVVMDDMKGTNLTREYMLRLCDRYPLKVEIKGGVIEFVAKKIYITTNEDARLWFDKDPAWLRRITKIVDYSTPNAQRT